MIIDIHTHTFPDELAERAMAVLYNNCKVRPCADGTCSGLCESMKRAGIDRSAVMPIATKPAQVRSINGWAASINKRYESLICFGSLHPGQEDWREEIDRLVGDGIPGVKFHPDYQGFFVDDPSVTPLYRALADAGLVVLFHCGVDIGLPPPVHCPPERLTRVLDAVPDLKVIAAHMGGYDSWDEVERSIIGRNVYLDTSYSLPYLGPERMAALIRSHGIERILFATDSPWADQSSELAGIRALPFSEDEKAAILGGNAVRLLGERIDT